MPHEHSDACPGCAAAPEVAFARHDHAHCASDVMERAEALAGAQGVRLTPVRRRALEILLEEHRALDFIPALVPDIDRVAGRAAVSSGHGACD